MGKRTGRPRGRPPGSGKKVDLDKLRNLALIGQTNLRIAQLCGISHDTLTRRYSTVLDQARGDAENRILARTFQLADKGCMRALELSLINRCHWVNRPELIVNVTQNAGFAVTDETRQKLAELHKYIRDQARNDDGSQFMGGGRPET